MWQDKKAIRLEYIIRDSGERVIKTLRNMGDLGWELDCMGWDTVNCDDYELVDIRIVDCPATFNES